MDERQRSSAGDAKAGTSTTLPTQGHTGEGDNGIMGRVRERAAAQLNTQKDRATDGVGNVVQVVRNATRELRDQHHETMAEYIDRTVAQVERFSSRLKNKDVTELVQDAQTLARRQPALFIGSAFALGLLGARFFKSSSPTGSRRSWQDHDAGRSYSGAASRAARPAGSAIPPVSSDLSSPATDRGQYRDMETR
jgi:hypothetical protein